MLDVYEFLAKEKKTLPHGIADLSKAPIAQPLTPKTPAALQEEAVRALKDAVASADVARGFRQAESAASMPEAPAMPISPLADIAKGFRSAEAMAPMPAPAVTPIQPAADIARSFRQAEEPERQFQQWYADIAGQMGISPNPDDPRHYYDYRGAFGAGATPEVDPGSGEMHLPSEFKLPGHPNRYVDGIDTITGKPGATPKQLAQLKEMLENEDHPARKQMLEQAPSAWKQAFNTFKRSARILAENAFLSLNLGVRPEVFYGEEGLLGKAPVEPVTIPEKITAGVGSILGSLPWFIMPETSVAKGIPLQPQGMLKLSGEAIAKLGPQTAKEAIASAAKHGAGAVGTISAIEAIAQKMSPKEAVKHIGLSTAAGALFAGGISAARIGISRIPQSDLGKMFHREYLRTRGYNQLGEELGFTADRGTGVWSKYDKKGNLSNIVIETRTPENEKALKVFDQLLRTYPDYAQGLGSADKAAKATAEVRALLPKQPAKAPGKIIPEDMFYPKENPAIVKPPGLLPAAGEAPAGPSIPEPVVTPAGQVVPTSTAKPDDTPPQAEKTSEEGVAPIPEPSKPGEIAAGMKPRSILSDDEVASAIAALRGEPVEHGATDDGKVVEGEESGIGEVAGTGEEPEKPSKPAIVAAGKPVEDTLYHGETVPTIKKTEGEDKKELTKAAEAKILDENKKSVEENKKRYTEMVAHIAEENPLNKLKRRHIKAAFLTKGIVEKTSPYLAYQVSDRLYVHKEIDGKTKKPSRTRNASWTVTIDPSGMALGTFKTSQEAIAAAVALERSGIEWGTTVEELERQRDEPIRVIKDFFRGIMPDIQRAGEAGEKAIEGAGKEVASLDDLKEEIGEKINEAVGDVNIPIGQSIKIVSGSPRSRGTFSSSDPDVDKRVKDSHGVKSPGTFSKIKELMDTIARKASREYEHLPKGAEFAQLRFDLLKLSKQKDVASYSTLKLIQGILLEFDKDPAGYNHFEWKVLLSDLAEEAQQDNDLPFGYTTDILDADIEALDKAIAAKFPQVERAMKIRRKIWDTIVNEYTKAQEAIGHKVGDKLERREYFRHQVMDYANEKAMRGTGKRLRTPTGRGFLKERKGSTLDINTNYLEAEYEVMAQMLYDIEVAKVIKDIDERDNIVRTLKAQAVAVNDERIMPMFEQMAEQLSQSKEPGKEVTAESLYRQILNSKQAIGFEKLGKMAMRGELPVDSKRKYEGLINKLSETYIANTLVGSLDDKASLPEWAMKQVFPYLNWLLKQQHVTDKAKGAAATIFKGIAEKKKAIKVALGDRYITWEDIIPDGYVKWQPREGNVFYFADTIPAQKAQLLFAQGLAQIGLTADEVEQVLVMGQRLPEMVLKEEIVLTLDNLVKDRQSDMLSQTLRKIIQGWKVYQLISPKRWAKYNIRNVSGDADPAFIGNPSTFKKVPQSAKELLTVYFGDGAMTEAMRRWFERGGMQSTMQVQEMGDINQLKMFVDLVERRGKITEVPAKAWQGYWKAARLSTDYREAILRYAAFLDYREQMKGNKEGRPKNFGASIPEEIMALKDIDDRAFWLSNDLLGAYDKVSVLGQWTRESLIPFWSWKEVNFKRYIQFAKNAVRDENLCRMAGNTVLARLKRSPATALRVGKFIIKALALWAMLETFNHTFFPEEEFELSPDVRNTPHIVLGRDKKGRAKYFPRLGALGDFVEWFGLEEAPGLARDFLNGRKNLKEIAAEMAKGPVNAFVQGIGPQYTIPVELIFGRKIFPDVFKPGMMRDKGYYIAQSLGLENEYAVIMKLPRRPYADSLEKMAVYKQDPGQGSYYEILDLKREFQEKMGKPTGFMSAVSPKSQALYNLKLAIRYQDKAAFDKYAAEYISYGGTDRDLKTSLNNMHPLHGLNKKEKRLFLEWLDDDDKKRLGLAIMFYEETLLGKGRQEKEE